MLHRFTIGDTIKQAQHTDQGGAVYHIFQLGKDEFADAHDALIKCQSHGCLVQVGIEQVDVVPPCSTDRGSWALRDWMVTWEGDLLMHVSNVHIIRYTKEKLSRKLYTYETCTARLGNVLNP